MLFLILSVVQLTNIDVNETVEGDERAFEIWHEREDSVRKYTLQARTVILKNSWLRELRNLQQRYSMPAWGEDLASHDKLKMIDLSGDRKVIVYVCASRST